MKQLFRVIQHAVVDIWKDVEKAVVNVGTSILAWAFTIWYFMSGD